MLLDEVESLKQENSQLKEQLVAMQAQLMQAQKLGSIGVLASSITHEFNNILMTVINYSKMGLRHRDNDTREKAFNKILDAGQR
ncbi:MAG: sensor histidine kinase, partial [Planctomycetaceae bacterium]|nr:sensor histidine kinase [Planctomycetaceae bacterium]